MNAMHGMYLVACRQTVSDCGCTPATASKYGDRAIEHAADRRSTSAVKSTWPGVSMMLMRSLIPENFVNARLLTLRPRAGRRRRRDRNPALALLFHPIGHGRAFMHFSDFVDHAGVKQNALSQCRFAGIDIRCDPDVSRSLERKLAIGRIRILRRGCFERASRA